MQREIKFRAKVKFGAMEGQWLISSSLSIRGERLQLHDGNEWWECDLKTLGQFTGLYDKNGREIYEGDIAKWPFESTQTKDILPGKGFIKFHPSYLRWDIGELYEFNQNIKGTKALLSDVNKCVEIIGNIHLENPKLLTKNGE